MVILVLPSPLPLPQPASRLAASRPTPTRVGVRLISRLSLYLTKRALFGHAGPAQVVPGVSGEFDRDLRPAGVVYMTAVSTRYRQVTNR
ncbi:hypothetical protein GCM10027184_03520 [Saccharothrix stipae]